MSRFAKVDSIINRSEPLKALLSRDNFDTSTARTGFINESYQYCVVGDSKFGIHINIDLRWGTYYHSVYISRNQTPWINTSAKSPNIHKLATVLEEFCERVNNKIVRLNIEVANKKENSEDRLRQLWQLLLLGEVNE